MNLKAIYNSSEDSDIEIVLSNGAVLHAHRVVLRASSGFFKKLLSSSNRTYKENGLSVTQVSFPDHSDKAIRYVIARIYGLENLACCHDDWLAALAFAHYIAANELTHMIDNLHAKITFSDLMIVNELLSEQQITVRALRLFNKQYPHDTDGLMREFVNCSRVDNIHMLNKLWVQEKYDPWILFQLDHKVCEAHGLSMGDFIAYIDFARFDTNQLLLAVNTLFTQHPQYAHLLTCMLHAVNTPAWKQPKKWRRGRK